MSKFDDELEKKKKETNYNNNEEIQKQLHLIKKTLLYRPILLIEIIIVIVCVYFYCDCNFKETINTILISGIPSLIVWSFMRK